MRYSKKEDKKVYILRFGTRCLGLILAFIICTLSVPHTVCATEETKQKLKEAQDKRQETQSQLDDKKNDINAMNTQKNGLQGQLGNLNSQLTQVSDNLAEIESKITAKQNDIDTTKKNLDQAKKIEEEQYAAMKKRVQFMYERQNHVVLEMFLKAKSFADFLNQSDYVAELSAYDRKMLEKYQQTKEEITKEEAALEKEMSELNEYQVKQQAEQSRVSGLVSQTSGNISKYANQISDVQKQAEAIESDISKQDADIKALQAKLAEEIRMSQLAAQSAWRDISEVTFADGDRYLLANLIYCEAGGEPYAGKLAVGAVVINRVLSSVYPNTVVGVIYQNRQFSPVASGRLALALAEGRATSACYQAADEAMSGTTNVGECVYFRTPIDGLTGINIGGHVFY